MVSEKSIIATIHKQLFRVGHYCGKTPISWNAPESILLAWIWQSKINLLMKLYMGLLLIFKPTIRCSLILFTVHQFHDNEFSCRPNVSFSLIL